MQTLIIHIPDAQYPHFIEELHKFEDIKIEFNSNESSKEEILEGIRQSVIEINLIKDGKSKGRPVKEFLKEILGSYYKKL